MQAGDNRDDAAPRLHGCRSYVSSLCGDALLIALSCFLDASSLTQRPLALAAVTLPLAAVTSSSTEDLLVACLVQELVACLVSCNND